MKADLTIDCLGVYCPMPIIKTAEEINNAAVGSILEILADDPGVVEDMPNWCKMTGQEFLEIESHNGEYKVYIRKVV